MKNTWLKRRSQPRERKLDNQKLSRKKTLKKLKLENKRLRQLIPKLETKKLTALLLARTRTPYCLDSKVLKMITTQVKEVKEDPEVAEVQEVAEVIEVAEAVEAKEQVNPEEDKLVVPEVADNNS